MGKISKRTRIIIIVIGIIIVIVGYYFYQKDENNIIIENINENANYNINNEIEDSEKNIEKIMVYISGAVNSPGVIEIKSDMRVTDAIELANGLKDNADLTNINLAEKLQDECKIYIPEKSDINNDVNTQSTVNVPNKSTTKKLININTSKICPELDILPVFSVILTLDYSDIRYNIFPSWLRW